MMRTDSPGPVPAELRFRHLAMVFALLAGCTPQADYGKGGNGGSGGQSEGGSGGQAAKPRGGESGSGNGGGQGGGEPAGGAGGAATGGAGSGGSSPTAGAGSGGEGGQSEVDAGSAGQEPDVAPEPAAPKLSTDVLPIVKMRCARAGCHDPIKKEHGMDLSTAENIHAVWVDRETADHCRSNMKVVRVVPGEPQSSFVVTLIEAQPGRCKDQERMPPSPLPVLEEEEVKIITDWIAAGAKDD